METQLSIQSPPQTSDIDLKALDTSSPGAYVDPFSKDSDPELEIAVLPRTDAQVDEQYPDGGFRAWAVVLGAFFTGFSTWGLVNSWGIFQVYYQEVLLPHSTPSEISWIGSAQRSLVFLPGVFVGRLFDLGYFRVPFVTGCLLVIIGNFLLPLCKVYWHFLLCQGFMIGLGCGLTFGPTSTIITHWWKRKRGFAFGISALGSSIGGIFFPIVTRQLLNKVGFAWTLRTLGFIVTFTFSIANLCLVRRFPPRKALGKLFGLRVFRSPSFTLFCLSYFVTPLGSFTVPTYLSVTAVSAGFSSNFAFYLVAILSGAGAFGGVAFGLYGDAIGAMNAVIQAIALTCAITIAWPFCTTVPSLCAIAILYGFSQGAFTALGIVPVASMGGIEDLGQRMGTVTTVLGIGGLCGPPLSGLLVGTHLGFKAVGFFAGGMLLLGDIIFTISRFMIVPGLRSKF